MTETILRVVALGASLVAAFAVQAAPILSNGSLTGRIANGAVPPGWSTLAGSPDTMDQNNNLGLPGATFVAAPSGPSPNGGTWVGMARDDNAPSGNLERFGQALSGFTISGLYICTL